MSDKLVAGLVTAAAVGPICAVCILGPTFAFSWVSGLFAGLSPVGAAGVAIFVPILGYGLLKRRKARRAVSSNEASFKDGQSEGS